MERLLKILLCCLVVGSYLGSAFSVEHCLPRCRCTEKTITCGRSSFSSLPDIKNKKLLYLSLIGNHLQSIKSNSFDDFKDLVHLDLSYNKISHVEDHAFKGPIDLQTLKLRNNQIKMLPEEIFSEHQESLKILSLSYNRLERLPISLEKLINLKRLELYGNPLHCGCEVRYFVANLRILSQLTQKTKCHSPARVNSQYLEDVEFEKECDSSQQASEQPPSFIEKPSDVYVAEGDKAKVYCQVADITTTKVEWKLPFNDSTYHQFYWRNQLLVIKEVHDFHSGIFTCTAYNNKGSISASSKLSIAPHQKPYIIEGPSSVSVSKGSQVVFYCRAKGYPVPEITWLWVKSSQIRLETEGKYTVRKNMLIIDNITEQEAEGRYVCYASSLAGSAKVSGEITLERLQKDVDQKGNEPIPTEKLKNEQLYEIIKEAQTKINEAFKKTAERLRDPNRKKTSNDIQSLFRQPSLAALELAKASDVYEKVIDDLNGILRENKVKLNLTTPYDQSLDLSSLLSAEQLAIISQLSGCQRSTEELHCSQQLCFHKKYRSIDGKCNNLIHPRRGSALSPFYRLIKPEYENGINTPIGWTSGRLYFGYPKPSARLVSSKLLRAHKITPDHSLTAMVMQWGQFLDHDLDFTPVDASSGRFSDGLGCNETCVNDSPCFPILTPPGDLRVKRPCIGFSRSIATCGSGQSSIILGKLHYREQVNQITSFIDGSNVYSSDPTEAIDLRDITYDEGKLRVGPVTEANKRLLPFNIRGQVDCQQDPGKTHVPCFKAGDHRSNENLGLLTMHTIWMREHNRLAEELRSINNHWTGDKVYFEARKIVGAMMQHITYKNWLPIVLGRDEVRKLGEYRGYDDMVDPTISSAFATAAMRFGHTLINPILFRLNEKFETIPQGNLPLHKAFFAPERLMEDGGMDPIIRGLFAKGSKAVKADQVMNTELIEKLFAMAHEIALDLGALNIQRGRDHGIPSYNSWRELCGLKKASTFDDFSKEIVSEELREKMRQVYGHPGNVDLFAGAVLEQKVSGGLVGPTLSCILTDQFKRLRDGDRFWYESHDQFDASQLSQIRQVSLARVICDNGDNITRVQKDIFVLPKSKSEFIDCRNIPKLNLIPWKECYDTSRISPEDQVPGTSTRFRRSAPIFESSASKDTVGQCDRHLNNLEERIKNIENKLKEKH